jgi:hypothetical protein
MKFKYFINEKITTKKIFVDLDGVLCDFIAAANELFNVKNFAQWNDMKKTHWKKIVDEGPDFWSNMSWTNDGKKLWDYVVKNYNNVQILSAKPIDNGESELGKKLWIRKNLGSSYAANAIICYGVEKQNYADFNNILIDDSDRNIRQWINKNGIGILHKNTNNTIKQLENL